MKRSEFFALQSQSGVALTFDDVTLNTGISDVLPAEVDVTSKFSKNITLASPFASAAMSAVTGYRVVAHMALFGGIGVIHYSFETIEEQAREVGLVKSFLTSPEFLEYEERLVGIYPRDRWELDTTGRLHAAAAISTLAADPKTLDRALQLVDEGVNVLVLDASHGATKTVLHTVEILRASRFCDGTDLVVGNVSNGPCAVYLAEAGVDGIKVGQGCGASCTTREKTGCGKPQLSAIAEVVEAISGLDIPVPVCADGGINHPGDVTKALAAGASTVMLGRLIASTDEAPNGDVIIHSDGSKWKAYWGMGSDKEREGKSRRYGNQKRLAQGISGEVKYLGPINDVLMEYESGLRHGMGQIGAANIPMLTDKADFNRLTGAGYGESRPHHMVSTESKSN